MGTLVSTGDKRHPGVSSFSILNVMLTCLLCVIIIIGIPDVPKAGFDEKSKLDKNRYERDES